MTTLHRNFLAMATAAALGAAMIPGTASAGTATTALAVSATVVNNCTITTAPLAFGTYDTVGGAALNGTGTVTVACTSGATSTIGFALGGHASGSVRRMSDVAVVNFLSYEIYQPPSNTPGAACSFPGTTVWGTAGANLLSLSAAPSKAGRTYNICGTINAGQDVPAGGYSDTVNATVTF